MNDIILRGLIKNISYSHSINDIEYNKADLIVPNNKGNEDIIDLKFKKCIRQLQENELISLTGTIRSFSQKLDENKNKVSIYVFTYFDEPAIQLSQNAVTIDGRICKIDPIKTLNSGKTCIHAILANNLFVQDQSIKINNYIPIVFWGNLAKKANELKVSDKILISGQLHSRTYTKTNKDGVVEIRTAHEIVVQNYAIQL